ncbi:sigma-54-dependent transcriptional regulator [Desulfolutivibrio sulfoxidireducens]|uniref:sigma-54-dependent transcriptional regulator n=1 Tax=Desulfolutivibrio sulfoxidireducens TaxID=2773299 RepID=UPI00159E4C0C|nr:sigma-54 dependent transcriptional regulator [Desulfolutivibrio sulfoxidireducens]QLA14790.1 response regulator [Desulfolutivibrio sulfoxidireducens]
MAKVLVIDDDQLTCEALMDMVRHIGHEAEHALCGSSGMAAAQGGDFDVIFLDVRLPDCNGLELLPRLRELPRSPEVIILTGLGDPDGAELAIRNGAWDYLRKPISPKAILLPLRRVLRYRDALREQEPTLSGFDRCGIAGESPAMRHALERLAAAARSDTSVLLTGETGTGKELFAHALHANSRRAKDPFVIVDCAAIPANLLESTLLGHVKGAFTGADKASPGLILEACGGTLFLDELGELPLDLQKKLLRVLQERRYRPVGGSQEVSSDFRLVAATNRDLEAMAEREQFRRDLLFRLGATTIELPPLRDRKEDIEELARKQVHAVCEKNGIPLKEMAPDFLEVLREYAWPGNVRELVNVIESSVAAACSIPMLFARHLPERLRIAQLKSSFGGPGDAPRVAQPESVAQPRSGTSPSDAAKISTYKEFRQDVLLAAERDYFARVMAAARWDIGQACELSGLGKSRLYAQLKRHGIDKS